MTAIGFVLLATGIFGIALWLAIKNFPETTPDWIISLGLMTASGYVLFVSGFTYWLWTVAP